MSNHLKPEALSAYLDGETEEKESRSVKDHLQSCRVCQAGLDRVRSIRSALRSVPRHRMPESLATRIQARANEKLASRPGWGALLFPKIWIPTTALAMTALLVVADLVWLPASRPREIPMEALLAAHHRYVDEMDLPGADLSAEAFSAKLASATYEN